MTTARASLRGASGADSAGVVVGLALALLAGVLVSYHGATGFLVVLGVLGGLVVLRWPFAGLVILAGSIGIENVFVVHGAGGAATGSRLLGMFVFGAWILGKLLRKESVVPLIKSALFVTTVLLFAFALASTMWARVPHAALSGAFQLAQHIALGLITFDLARSWKRVDMLVKALVVGAMVAALLTIQQSVWGGARRGGDNIAGGINETAIVLVTILPFAFYLLRSRASIAWRMLGIAYIGVGVTATILTYSRMNLLVLPVILALLSFHTLLGRRGRVPILVAAAVSIGVGLYAIPTDRLQKRLDTIVPYLEGTVGGEESGIIEPSARGYHLRVGIAIARDEPVISAGYRNYGYLFRDEYQFVVPGAGTVRRSVRSPHSSHVGMLADLGGVGFSLWLAVLFGAGLIPAIRAWRRSVQDPGDMPHLLSQTITYALGLHVFAYGFYAPNDREKILWILLGLAVAAWSLVCTPAPRATAGSSQ
jgi:hypothetical protein